MLEEIRPSLRMGPTLISQNLPPLRKPEMYESADHRHQHANGALGGQRLSRNLSQDLVQHMSHASQPIVAADNGEQLAMNLSELAQARSSHPGG